MRTVRVVIVGAGLSGLYAAHLLKRAGIEDFALLEARAAPGGRIRSEDGFDLGATWFWPALQGELDGLVRQLGLARLAQHEAGDMLLQHEAAARPMRTPGYRSSPAAVRLAGGMGTLIDALHGVLDRSRIVTGQRVRRLRCDEQAVELEAEDGQGRIATWRAGRVLLAVPPRLAAATIDFAPALPETWPRRWKATATWMAPHAKYVAAYEAPFWREQGLSGEARSACGPLAEIHDASVADGRAALFGFFAWPAGVRRGLSDDVLKSHCRAQLARLFGPRAAHPTLELVKDWAADPCTATAADRGGFGQHAAAPPAAAAQGVWQGRLIGIASEWSPSFSGYLAGAVEAAGRGVHAVTDLMETSR
ncbi:FAD-dependent oxidoreductase [Acidovorax sp. MR-S7]|uniref:flavin monoamine oxidase family protein n=1 Tax=Acidovorax sp. MR-S7 TaxID=1268622 RepID=UPI0003D3BC60|nr:FAD-dependent oxidoreductase [Acidovorax sp. MR-S7]GAD21694.1 monoamine oxidase [Acidovorax sp. MR-S7]